jgi:hypothetical protein
MFHGICIENTHFQPVNFVIYGGNFENYGGRGGNLYQLLTVG